MAMNNATNTELSPATPTRVEYMVNEGFAVESIDVVDGIDRVRGTVNDKAVTVSMPPGGDVFVSVEGARAVRVSTTDMGMFGPSGGKHPQTIARYVISAVTGKPVW